MSMALALEHAMEWLRTKNGWKPNECGVNFEAIPPADAGPFYVSLDDGGIESGDDRTDALTEILNITVGVWRRTEHLMRDQRGLLKLPFDKYVLGAYTLHELERRVILHTKHGFHNNWTFRESLNARYNLPSPEMGAEFISPLTYRGRGKIESVGFDVGGGPQRFFGYRLRFRGLLRAQKLRGADVALG